MNCNICFTYSTERDLIKSENNGINFTLEQCHLCKATGLISPPPLTNQYYLDSYRSDIPRLQSDIVAARSEDSLAISAMLKIRGITPNKCIDLCAEDDSVSSWAIFGENCLTQTVGITGTNTFSSFEEPESESYEAASCFTSLEHIENPMDIIDHAYRMLSSGGLFFVSAPNIGVAFNPIDLKPHHTWYFFGHSLSMLIARRFSVFAEIKLNKYQYVGAFKI